MNKLIAEQSDGKKGPETFTGFTYMIWTHCIKHSDQYVATGKKATPKKEYGASRITPEKTVEMQRLY